MDIKIGNVVCFKMTNDDTMSGKQHESGSIMSENHKMTVVSIKGNEIECQWYDKELTTFNSFLFPSELLTVDLSRLYNDYEPQKGSVVQLKSESPKMTVTGVNEDGVVCMWYDEESGNYMDKTFLSESLVVFPDSNDVTRELKTGYEVELKSGSTAMKIASLNADGKQGEIKCIWVDKKNRVYKEGIFHPESLKIWESKIPYGGGTWIV